MLGFNNFGGSGSSITSFFSKATNSVFSSLGCPSLSSLGLSFSNIFKLLNQNSIEENVELKDVNLQTSTYNRVIPEVFGSVRVAGNVIWASEIRKINIHHSAKMTKNGSQSAYNEYMVRGSFAIAICKGEVDEIKNIYVNDEPLNLTTYNIKMYYGDEKQKPDTTIQSLLGNNTPAFRGLCYVVFTEFPMEEFGGVIPNFTFDVVKTKNIDDGENEMEHLVKAITIIPGSGEFVYDTITQKKLNGDWIANTFYETEKATILNNHTTTKNTDAVDSLNDLQKTFPNLEWVSLVVCWFCDSLDCGEANVYPACENRNSITMPDSWQVGTKTRNNAMLVGLDEKENIRYGGTPSDACVKRYAQEIKRRGLKLCVYPMLMVDVDKKPWRGHITGDVNEIESFFTKSNGYNNFVCHYAKLLRDYADAIIIGSEMVGLTRICNKINNAYPAVDEFCKLSGYVRKIVGNNVKITYAADWSEYHHDDRGDYNLDKLWANQNIDFVGIDAYFPLTDETKSTYDIEMIKEGWRSGEGYDFYYEDTKRTIKKNLSPRYAWKNVEWFWKNEHYNSNGKKTEWIPKSKKIWFTEYGFPSVDCCTNQPNVFYSVGSLDSAFPRHSSGNMDFKAQRIAIKATELAWQNSDFVENKFLYTWDARPYPYFPNLSNVWADAGCWKYGHFLNGKSGISMLSNVIAYLCEKAGLNKEDYDVSMLKENAITGYIVDDKKSVLVHLKTLAVAFRFDAYIEDGKIIFKSLDDANIHKINADDIIVVSKSEDKEGENKKLFDYENIGINHIPSSVELLFIDCDKNYSSSTAMAKNNDKNNGIYSTSIKVPMNISRAQEIAWSILSSLSNQNTIYNITLPISYIFISPLDRLLFNNNGEEHSILVKEIEVESATQIKIIGVPDDVNREILSNLSLTNDVQNIKLTTSETSYIAETNFDVFELYNTSDDVNSENLTLRCAIWSGDKNWKGATIYYSTDNEKNYNVFSHITSQTSIGKILNYKCKSNCASVSANYIDDETSITFSLHNENGKLVSIDDEDFSHLKNKVLIDGEIIAFRDVQQVGNNVFTISHLLRGRFNTEQYIKQYKIGDDVILIDEDFFAVDIPITKKDKPIYFKVISDGETLLNATAKRITPIGKSLMNFEVKNLDKKTMQNGDIRLSFSARKNYKITNLANFAYSNKVMVKIFDNNNVCVRASYIENNNHMYYTTSMQKNDFGCVVGQNEIYFTATSIVEI